MTDQAPLRTPAAMLARRLRQEQLSRRRFLAGMAAVGAGLPLLTACGAGATPTPSPTAPPTPTPAPGETPGPTPEPTPVPTPEAEVNVYNWDEYIGETTISSFEEKYGVKVNYTIFPDYETMVTNIGQGNSGHDVTFATGLDVPGFLARGLVQPLDLSLIPDRANLGPDWQDPDYDPGNAHSMPYMWWTTGFAYDTEKIKEDLTSWAALWDERWNQRIMMLDDYREVFAVALMRLGYSVNTTSDAELDEALALLQQQRPLLIKYTADDITDLRMGNVDLCHAWSGSAYTAKFDRPSLKYVIPTEGGVRGSDTMVLLANAPHPVAAHLFINHMLDAEVSAGNTNYTGYMGPNEAAKAFIDPAILDDPTVNPDRAAIDRLVEETDLGADLEKYSTRFVTLKAGA